MTISRILFPFIIAASMSGCVALTAVSAVPSALIGVVSEQFGGQEASFAYSMRRTIASIQASLQSMELDIDILEPQENGGYLIGFSNDNLDGNITLRRQTERLTTLYIKVRTNTREESVERAIIDLVEQRLKSLPAKAEFDKRSYQPLMKKPAPDSSRVAWFRPGAKLSADKSGKQDWLVVKLPSGKLAYLKGSITQK
ncbi:SH3 domain-containing protein [Mariprofundus erugo]|nr:SH3 domain-containing protein [Mariprofundus erugo]